jgi:hypothetical protein
MSERFGISQIEAYLTQMGLKLARVDQEKEVIEIVFQSSHSQWKLIVGFQQGGNVRKLMFLVPYFGKVGTEKRLESLEALLAVNYRIAIGKLGLDLSDGEVRLEETIALADNILTFKQFQLALGAIVQTVSIYRNLLPRVVNSDASIQDALSSCEQAYFQSVNETALPPAPESDEEEEIPELSVEEVMAEVNRLLKQSRD